MDPEGTWTLRGYDTFADESYPLEGEFSTQADAEKAAHSLLQELEIEQPSSSSGGQTGEQDRVYIIRPDGTGYRYLAGDRASD